MPEWADIEEHAGIRSETYALFRVLLRDYVEFMEAIPQRLFPNFHLA